MTKSKKLKSIFRKAGIIFLLLMLFWIYNNYTLKITRTSITSTKINTPVRLAVLSDLHAEKFGISNRNILSRIDRIKPDAVIVLGDMYTRRSPEALMNIPVQLMKSMVDKGYRVYFVSGDHDISESYNLRLSNTGVHVMDFKSETLSLNNNKIKIMGIDAHSNIDINSKLTPDKSCYNILLAHIPNYKKYSKFGADLTLCADTHGGIIQIPFIGTAYDALTDTWLPKIFSKTAVYDKGWFRYKDGAMFITSGIGSYPIAARINNRPEIVSIEIKPKR